ncbi:MAG: hypothetical protein ACRYHQ_14130 [Janthinobacterium lividum]
MTVKRPAAQEAAWLSALHPSDRKHAQRWLKEVGGEGRLRRIAEAFNKAPAAAHRPPNAPLDLLDRALAHAAHLYVTTPYLKLGDAAGQTREHFAKEISAVNTTAQHFRRKLSDALKAQQETFFRTIAERLAGSGQAPRSDFYPDLAAFVQINKSISASHRVTALSPVMSSAFAIGSALPKTIADAYAQQSDAAVRARDLVEFAALFSLPDHLPISVVATWFDEVRKHLTREQEPQSDQSA